ncbi:alkaline phosphatase family protein [Algiphilus sp.]|uniref:alkaline phosphatase family protein n=1 Tax=Algiphilus sp. TaxID=1872431 RepID=UPI0025BBCE9C|nr:alkaline phosphatase family protein [Algiphilus sp.]MCK5770183.1 alkaline phosphatase family protein [Algiphilus sp.]
MSKTSTLFIGLDGCTYTVLDHLVSDIPGTGVVMPFMKKLMDEGARAKLRSTPNPLTPPAWTSVQTGRGPGVHGVFDFIRSEDKGGEVYWTLYDSRDIDAETIWALASRQGKTVAALNFPLTAPPPDGVNGCTVPGFIPAKHLRRNTHPRELFERMKQEIPGFDPKELAWDFEAEKQAMEALDEDDTEAWVRYHLPREEQWYKVADYVLRNEQPDLMAIMFDGVDKIQHQAWEFLDPALLPEEPTAWQARMRDVCVEYFRKLDGFIQSLVETAGPDVQVYFASDHGFTATTEVLRINTWLGEKGYLTWAKSDDSPQAMRREASDFANLDWDKTVAYCRTPSSNGIHIRVARNPGEAGIAPEEYERFRDKLIEDLESIRNDDGEQVVTDVLKREEWFPGAHMDKAADLTLVLRDHGFVSIRNYSPVVVPRERPQGTHHPDGIFMAWGQGIKAAGMTPRRRIVDVPATLLYSMGLSVPEDVEGKVPKPFFDGAWLESHPVTIGAATLASSGQREIEEMDDNEKQQIIEQLQMLGYME